MKRILTLGLLAFLAVGSSIQLGISPTPLSARQVVAANPSTDASLQQRDVFYLSDRFGFRFVYPSGYVANASEIKPGSQADAPVQVIELWQQADFLQRDQLPESPPIISISVFNNAQRLPLTRWKGELARNDDRPITVAGRPAIAYTSTGLYESDNVLVSSPDGRYVFRLKVGYLGAKDAIRQVFRDTVASFTFDTLPGSAANRWRINYNRLQTLLKARNWLLADVETRALIQRSLQLAGPNNDYLYGTKTVLNRVPCDDLKTLDTLWSQASQGRFGYKAQQRIWQQTAAVKNRKMRVERFAQLVGWRSTQPLSANPLRSELAADRWRLDTDFNPTAAAPVGQFPWAGVSSSRLKDLLNERSLGCGSCTVDAIYLATERYVDYVPALFNRLNQCRLR